MLLQTSTVEKHRHVVYVNEQNRQSECGKTKQHRHAIVYDPNTQTFVVNPAEDGHTHQLEQFTQTEPTNPRIKEDEAETLSSITQRFAEAYESERYSIERGQESIDFKEGNQWTPQAIQALASQKRAALTINHVAPMIETLSGIARQQRTDIKVLPVEGGDQFSADVLTQAIKQILVQNEFDHEEIDVFEDQVSTGRGVLEVYPDYDENIEGNIKVRYLPFDMITIAPHYRKDLSDAEYMFKWKWVSQAQLQNIYPEFKGEIEALYNKFNYADTISQIDTLTKDAIFSNPLYTNKQTKQLRLLECESKEYYTLKVWVNLQTAETIGEDEMPKDLAKQFKTLQTYRFVKRRLFRLRRTVTAGDKVLEDDYIDSPTVDNINGNAFSTIVVYAYKRGLYFEGKIERMKDPQRELNKRRSQTVDIVNTTINNGWFYGEDTFSNKRDEDNFLQNSSTAGFAIKINDVKEPPMKVAAGVVERGIVELEMNSQRSLREITNINTELLGQAPSYQSGVALQHQQRAALVGNEYLFDNFNRGKKELGRRLIAWIQRIYTPERIARMVLNQAMVDKVFINKEQLDPKNQQQVQVFIQKVKQMLDNQDLNKYDVAIGESNSTPTTQLANLQMMQQLAASGVPIPPMALLEMSPIPNKEQIMQMLQQQQQAEQQAENQKYQTEIQKTVIAHQGKNNNS